ncbi:MAG: DedA family protein [Clostridia bacterium]|nr:DedA family protein [Clostridia bacterium]
MQEIIIEIMNQFGYIGICLLILVENVFPPIPSEVILTFGGFMTTQSEMSVLGVILVATIGSVLGAIVLYLVGRLINKDVIEKWLDGKVGKILRFKRVDVEKANSWFERKGKWTVLFCRCIPIVRSLISIPAGMSKMAFTPFILLTTLGSAVWNTVLVALGNIAGNSWEKISRIIDKFSDVILVVLIVAVVVFLVYHFTKKDNKEVKNQTIKNKIEKKTNKKNKAK